MTMWALIMPSEDGNPLHLVDRVDDVLDDPGGYSIERFAGEAYLREHPDPNYWAPGTAVLVQMSVVVPQPVTTSYRLPDNGRGV